jgi:hypothetical protein
MVLERIFFMLLFGYHSVYAIGYGSQNALQSMRESFNAEANMDRLCDNLM